MDVRVNDAVAHRVLVVSGCTHNEACAVGDMACVDAHAVPHGGADGHLLHVVGDTLALGYVLHCNHCLIL